MTEGLNFSRIYSVAFSTIHQEVRNILIDKRFIAKIRVCLLLYCFTEHPVMLRDAAGEKGKYKSLSFINIQIYPHEFSTEPY